MSRAVAMFGVFVGLSIGAAGVRGASFGFQGIGDLSGGNVNSQAFGISADGSTVGGKSASAQSANNPAKWTSGGGIGSIGVLPGGTSGQANGLNADGSIIVGFSSSTPGQQAFLYNGTTMTGLGALNGPFFSSTAYAVNNDGTVVVGESRSYINPNGANEAFRWTQATGMVGLGALGGGSSASSSARAVSSDGTIIAGNSTVDAGTGTRGFLWTLTNPAAGTGVMTELPNLNGRAEVYGMNWNATAIVGSSLNVSGQTQPVVWRSGGVAGLAFVAAHTFGLARDVSDDGSTIVGYTGTGINNTRAAIWLDGNVFDLKQYLIDQGVTTLTGWTLTQALGISADGMTITGNGTNASGQVEGWVATIPSPAAGTMFALPLVCLVARRRR